MQSSAAPSTRGELSVLLGHAHQSSCSSAYFGPRDVPHHDIPLIIEKRCCPLPRAIASRIESLNSNYTSGVFPEISRAWVVVDDSLYFWDYETNQHELVIKLSYPIVHVQLCVAPIQESTFVQNIKHVLVVSTAFHIHLYCVRELTPPATPATDARCTQKMQKTIQVLDPQITASVDGATILCIIGTQCGRIFMGGEDGHIYELCYADGFVRGLAGLPYSFSLRAAANSAPYENDQGSSSFCSNYLLSGGRRKILKVNHTRTLLQTLTPHFLYNMISLFSQSPTDEPIVAMAASQDVSRPWIFVLHRNGTLRLVFLSGGSKAKKEFRLGPQLIDICGAAKAIMKTSSEFAGGLNMDIFSIHPVHLSESQSVCLVAVTTKNCRIYVSAEYSAARPHEPVSLRVVHVRMPPSRDLPHSLGQASQQMYSAIAQPRHDRLLPDVSAPLMLLDHSPRTTYYAQGVFLSANSTTTQYDTLLCTSNEGAAFTSSAIAAFREHPRERCHVMHLDDRVQCIVEVDPETGKRVSPETDQFTEDSKPRHFLVMTTLGLHVLCKQRPIDELLFHLNAGVSELRSFFQQYGRDYVCYLLLTIACQNLGSVRHSLAPSHDRIDQNAVRRHFFACGGTPQQQMHVIQRAEMATAAPPPTIDHSGCYEALKLYLNRLLSSFSKTPAFVFVEGRGKLSRVECRITEEELNKAHEQLSKLHAFVRDWDSVPVADGRVGPHHRHPPRYANSYDSSSSFKSDGPWSAGQGQSHRESLIYSQESHRSEISCWQQEWGDLQVLFEKIGLLLEAVRFVQTLMRVKLPDIAYKIPSLGSSEPVQELLGKPIEYLVSDLGRALCGELVILLVQHASQHLSVNQFALQLRSQCSKLVPENDVLTALILQKLAASVEPASKAQSHHERHDSRYSVFGQEPSAAATQPSNAKASRNEAIQIARSCVGQLTSSQFDLICSWLVSLDCTRAILELSLQRARDCDPTEDAFGFVKDGRPMNDPRESRFEIRLECYFQALRAFEQLDVKIAAATVPVQHLERHREATRARALELTDRLWHYAYYDWIAQTYDPSRLLEIKPPYFEEWLKLPQQNSVHAVECRSSALNSNLLADKAAGIHNSASTLGSTFRYKYLSIYDRHLLLAKYYIVKEDFAKAARTYFELAQAESTTLSLDDRIELLQRAMQAARAAPTSCEILAPVRDLLDVANLHNQLIMQLQANGDKNGLPQDKIADLQTMYEVAVEYGLPIHQLRIVAMSQDQTSLDVITMRKLWEAAFDSLGHCPSQTQLESLLAELLDGNANSGSPVYSPHTWVSVVQKIAERFHIEVNPDWWRDVAVNQCGFNPNDLSFGTYF